MPNRNTRVIGEQAFYREGYTKHRLVYHQAHFEDSSRMYWCDCFRGIRGVMDAINLFPQHGRKRIDRVKFYSNKKHNIYNYLRGKNND
jgi:hypothetical protein